MIITFLNTQTQKIFRREYSKVIPVALHRVAQRKLEMLNAATRLEDLKIPPNNRLEKLSGDREGQYSIRINDKYRICFCWQDGNCYDVEIVDYH